MEAALNSIPYLLEGLIVTIEVTILVVIFATGIGIVFGIFLCYGPGYLRLFIRIYSDFIRGIPILVLIFFVYYGFPAIGINLDNFTAAVVALTIFKISHVVENTRGALESIHSGQMEAAKSIGLNFRQRMIYVIFPLAIRRFLPPWINSVADTAKGSALVSLIGVVDLMLAMQKVIGRTYEPMPVYIVGIIIYFIINFSLSATSRRLENKFSYTE